MSSFGSGRPAGMISSPAGGQGISVADGNGITRVTLGKISPDPDPDYGLQVIGPGGQTTIIDDTSDVFKIVATGTMTATAPPNTLAVSTVLTLPGLGIQTITPMCLFTYAIDVNTNAQGRSAGGGFQSGYASGSGECQISGGFVQLILLLQNADPAQSHTVYARYYVLFEAGM